MCGDSIPWYQEPSEEVGFAPCSSIQCYVTCRCENLKTYPPISGLSISFQVLTVWEMSAADLLAQLLLHRKWIGLRHPATTIAVRAAGRNNAKASVSFSLPPLPPKCWMFPLLCWLGLRNSESLHHKRGPERHYNLGVEKHPRAGHLYNY